MDIKKTPSKFYFILFFIIFVLILIIIINIPLFGDSKKKGRYYPPETVTVVKAKKIIWHPYIVATGYLSAVHNIFINSSTHGMVSNIYFNTGQMVKKGELLIELDDKLEKQLLNIYSSRVKMLTKLRDKAIGVHQTQYMSEFFFDQILSSLAQAKAQYSKLNIKLSGMRIHAPFNGKVGSPLVDLGSYLNPGDKIVKLVQTNPLYVKISIPGKYFPDLYVGEKISVQVDMYNNKFFPGKLTGIEPFMSKKTQQINAKGILSNINNKLIPGSFVKVYIYLKKNITAIKIPETSVVSSFNNNKIVYIIKNDKNNKQKKSAQKAYQRSVKFLASSNEFILLTSGINENDLVVTSGQNKLSNGSYVKIVAQSNLYSTHKSSRESLK